MKTRIMIEIRAWLDVQIAISNLDIWFGGLTNER